MQVTMDSCRHRKRKENNSIGVMFTECCCVLSGVLPTAATAGAGPHGLEAVPVINSRPSVHVQVKSRLLLVLGFHW